MNTRTPLTIVCHFSSLSQYSRLSKAYSGKFLVFHLICNFLPNSKFWHYSFQLNTYKYILEQNYDIKVKQMMLVQLHESKSNYVKHQVPHMDNELEDFIESYKTNLRVSEAGAPINIGGNEFFSQPFKDIKRTTLDKIEEENRASFPMQKEQRNTTSGNIGNFIENEMCDIVFTASNTGSGQVISSSNTRVYLKHLSGTHLESNTITISGSSYIYGRESEINTIFTSATLVSNNIAPEEEVYWKGITHYDDELEKNEYNRTIKVLDSSLAGNAVIGLLDLLEE